MSSTSAQSQPEPLQWSQLSRQGPDLQQWHFSSASVITECGRVAETVKGEDFSIEVEATVVAEVLGGGRALGNPLLIESMVVRGDGMRIVGGTCII